MLRRFEVAKESVTRFPCVRLEGQQEFISLFPVTKIQTEEWVWRTASLEYDAAEFDAFFGRLEVRNTDHRLPKAVQSLARQFITEQSPENLLSLIATNLSLWRDGEEEDSETRFPTPKSEWGQLTGWLGGRVPYYHDWARTVLLTNLIPTNQIVKGVLQAPIRWNDVVRDLLCKVEQTISPNSTGLPFMREGLYELVADREGPRRYASQERQEARPRVAGESPIWPTLSSATTNSETLAAYRSLRRHTLPVVTIRLWYAKTELDPRLEVDRYESFEVPEIEPPQKNVKAPIDPQASEATSASSGRKRWSWFRRETVAGDERISPYISTVGRMKYKCPFCHQPVEPEVFMTRAHFCCYESKVEVQEPDGRKRMAPGGIVHSTEIPNWTVDQVTRQYLDVAQTEPDAVHTVSLGGFERAGKSTWLLSLGGLMDYPDGNPMIRKAFPEHWKFSQLPCSLGRYTRQETVTDRKTWTERMWIDGKLPPRNSGQEKAFRCPILFNCSPRGKSRRFLALVDDIAGEELFQNLPDNKNFPHISSTADAIFFVPAENISTVYLHEFVKRLGIARNNEIAVDLMQINLIVVISKIDQLKFGDRADRELLRRILPRPYRFPQYRGEENTVEHERWGVDDLKAYFAEMEEVHLGIESWLHRYKPVIRDLTSFFGSVRYCGLSSFGFQPTLGSGLTEEFGLLPFAPLPVRAVDPIFWLLKENHLIEF